MATKGGLSSIAAAAGDGGNDIGDVVYKAVRNIAFDLLIALNKLPPQPSENWERDALAATLWALIHGRLKLSDIPKETLDSLDEMAEWYTKQGFCGSEDFALVYGGRNVSSTLAVREAFRIQGHAAGLAFLSAWTEAMAGYVGLFGGWAPGDNIDAFAVGDSIRVGKPQLVVSNGSGSNPSVKGADASVWVGDRSWPHNGVGWLTGSGLYTLCHNIYGSMETFIKAPSTHETWRALADAKNSGKFPQIDLRLCSPEKGEVVRRATRNDVDALLTICREWLPRAPWPKDRFLVVRRASGIEAARLYGTEAPTAQLDYHSWRASDGQQRFMMVNDGYRQEYIVSSAVRYEPGFTSWTAYADEFDREGVRREISCDAVGTDPVLFAFEFGGDEPPIFHVPDVPYVVTPPPAPPPPSPGEPAKPPKKSDRTLLYAGAALLALALILAFTC